MIKIFMTGDNHIGRKYASYDKASVIVQSRIDAFDNMVQAANAEDCSLFVITGDLFESVSGASKKDIKTITEKLSGFNGTVAVLPGNHDYYGNDVKVWKDFIEVMSGYDNIKLLNEYHSYEISAGDEQVVLYPAICDSKHSAQGKNNLGWIKAAEIKQDGRYHIGVAHGSVEGETIDNDGVYFPMTKEELNSIPVDVWLIGHTHVPFPGNLTDNFEPCGKILNAGTHVQTDVSCGTEGLCFIVEIDDNKAVCAKKFVSGNLWFYRKEITVTEGDMENKLIQELRGIGDNSVVEVILKGAVSTEEYESRDSVIKNALSGFLEGTYDDNGLSELITEERINKEFAEISFSAKLLCALLGNPKEAQLAYELLKSLKEGK